MNWEGRARQEKAGRPTLKYANVEVRKVPPSPVTIKWMDDKEPRRVPTLKPQKHQYMVWYDEETPTIIEATTLANAMRLYARDARPPLGAKVYGCLGLKIMTVGLVGETR